MVASTLPGIVELSERYGVTRETVLSWIESGELQALDTARSGSTRRRYKFTSESLAAFEQRRSTGMTISKPIRQVKVHEFF